ncbi:MAG: hypothetical protein IIC76_05490 [Bacteroidetes bacterium]|nr:hypothetical protein [Bacteroidota bacterium]
MKKYQTYLFIILLCSFNVFAQSIINITSPNGGESWQTGLEQTITWSDNITEDVKIDLYKGGVFDSELFASTFSDGSKFWTIPVGTAPGSDYKIKLTSVDSSNIFDFSDADFTIFPSVITISTPNGGESWQAGTLQPIIWTDNITENVLIELYKGGLFHSIIESSTDSDGRRNWNISFALESGSDYSVKITSVDNPGIFDFSDTNFTIIDNEITVTLPNGGEDWAIESVQNITWTDNFVDNVEIQLFKSDIFHSQIKNSTESDGSYLWNISSALDQGSDYKIKILSVADNNIFDFSDADFTLSSVIIITSPNGGENWQTGVEQTITWSDNITEDVKIDLYKGGVFNSELFASTFSDGSKFWTIPLGTPPGSDYKIKISSVDSSNVFDFSNNDFTIFASDITISSPNGGESWQAGTTQLITWTDNITENVLIELYKSGLFHSLIIGSTDSDGRRNWSIPFTLESGSDFSVKITSVDNSGIFDFSDTNFTIIGNQVTLTSPNGGEDWLIGSIQNITWTDNLIGNVKIQLFKSGIYHSQIKSSTESDGLYLWSISSALDQGSDYKIKILSITDNDIFDFSDADFTLSSVIIVTSPNGSENWQAGSEQVLTWDDNITGNVSIELYKGGLLHSVISSSTTSDGLKTWDIPFTLESGMDYSIKITSIEDPGIFDISDADFSIIGNQVTVTSPNGSENWFVGSSQVINWTDNLTGNVEIQLFKGGVFHSFVTSSTTSDGFYNWNISTSLVSGSDYKIRISSIFNGNVFDFSDAEFTLSNEITVTSPNGAEAWQAGNIYNIAWFDNITGNVKIELYKDGVFDSDIISSATSNGSFNWDIPASTVDGSDYKVKVTSVDDTSLFDLSDADFTIFNGNITVSSPNGGESWRAGTTNIITWADNLTENVLIELYKGGSFNSVISTSTASDGSKHWNTPFDLESGTDYTVKITSVNDPGISDFSDSNFTIIDNQITVALPNGGENWQVESSHYFLD